MTHLSLNSSEISVFLQSSAAYSRDRIEELRKQVLQIPQLAKNDAGLCIYATGSYARQEASEHSDLDLFFVKVLPAPLSRIDKTLIDAALINITRDMRFGEFSGDGQYLEVHDLDKILEQLGSPADDYYNYFTARLLLLLESTPIYADELYKNAIEKIIASYYRDYEDHHEDFRPIFLVNDIVRFWKTMCLNYEHNRNAQVEDRVLRSKAQLKNLKLKFSRMVTCFSTIVTLAQGSQIVTQQYLSEIVHQPPLVRLKNAAEAAGETELLESLLEDYSWFLRFNGRPKEVILQAISDSQERKAVFIRAQQFGSKMYQLLRSIAGDGEIMRYLVI